MRLSNAIAAFSAAVVVTAVGAAHAEETRAERTATAAAVPWYERFTFSAGQQEQPPEWSSVNPRLPNGASTDNRWGLSVNIGEAAPTTIDPITPRDQAAIGAFYRFTPNVRVGGRLSVAKEADAPAAATAREEDEANAGVRLESAFRF